MPEPRPVAAAPCRKAAWGLPGSSGSSASLVQAGAPGGFAQAPLPAQLEIPLGLYQMLEPQAHRSERLAQAPGRGRGGGAVPANCSKLLIHLASREGTEVRGSQCPTRHCSRHGPPTSLGRAAKVARLARGGRRKRRRAWPRPWRTPQDESSWKRTWAGCTSSCRGPSR